MAETRASKAGRLLAESIIEMVNLMYQKDTALNFMNPLVKLLSSELERRKREGIIK